MRKFKYSLEMLLKYREGIEERERDELNRLMYKHQVETNIRNGLSAKLQETIRDMASVCADRSRDRELNWFHLYVNRLTQEIGESARRLTKLESEIRAQKEAVIEASKNRKTLASMKAKKEKEFLLELDRLEQKETDELVITRYAKAELRGRV